MPTKEGLSDETLYFVDTKTGVRRIFGGITEIDTVSEAQNLIAEEEKESSEWSKLGERTVSGDIAKGFSHTAVFTIKNFSIRDAYLKCLKDGIDVIWVPNNFRRMHGYRARRLSLRKRRAMKVLKVTWKR